MPLFMKVKRLNPKALLPTKAHEDDACFDIYVVEDVDVPPVGISSIGQVVISTGLAFELPPGYWMDIRPRSGLGFKGTLVHPGTLDEGYRGELKIKLFNLSPEWIRFKKEGKDGVPDRVAQVRLVKNRPTIVVEVGVLNETVRGTGGFGSSGGTPETGEDRQYEHTCSLCEKNCGISMKEMCEHLTELCPTSEACDPMCLQFFCASFVSKDSEVELEQDP